MIELSNYNVLRQIYTDEIKRRELIENQLKKVEAELVEAYNKQHTTNKNNEQLKEDLTEAYNKLRTELRTELNSKE